MKVRIPTNYNSSDLIYADHTTRLPSSFLNHGKEEFFSKVMEHGSMIAENTVRIN